MEAVNDQRVKLQLRIMTRPIFPENKRKMILLEGFVNPLEIPVDTLAKLAFDIEYTLNEKLPAIRVHSNIMVKNDERSDSRTSS